MNFEYHNPTHLVFGGGVHSRLGELVSRHGKMAMAVTLHRYASIPIQISTLESSNPLCVSLGLRG